MTADVRQQLSEALDEIEKLAKEAADGDSGIWFVGEKWNVYRAEDAARFDDPYDGEVNDLVVYGNVKPQSEHIARWDPSTVLRLVQRDRELLRYLASWEEITGERLDTEQALAADVTVGDAEARGRSRRRVLARYPGGRALEVTDDR